MPLLLLVLLMFTLGVTLAVSAVVGLHARPAPRAAAVIQLGLFVTPVVYGTPSISKSQTFLVIYSVLNPLVPVIDGLRAHRADRPGAGMGCARRRRAPARCLPARRLLLFKRLETGMADVA